MDINEVSWEEMKDGLRDDRPPIIRMHEGNRRRALQVCEIQNLMGGYYIWQTSSTASSRKSDLMMLDKVRRCGGTLVSVDDQRVWTNSGVLQRRILEEKERRKWRAGRDLKPVAVYSWGDLFRKAAEEQVNARELECDFVETELKPRRI